LASTAAWCCIYPARRTATSYFTDACRLTLGAQARDDSSRLAASIKQALAVARGEPLSLEGTLQIKRPSGRRPLVVQVTPLPAPAFSPWAAIDGGARVMIQIVDPQASLQAQAEKLRLLAGLTAA
jgi:hypothetical protein